MAHVAATTMEKLTSTESRVAAARSALRVMAAIVLLGLVLQGVSGLAYAWKSPSAEAPAGKQPAAGVRAFPRISFGGDRQLEYIGAFSADGKFKALSKLGKFMDSMTGPVGQPGIKPDEQLKQEDAIMAQVPPNVELHQNERMVEDVQPPERAVQVAKGHSSIEELRDSFVSLAYGAKRVLISPQSVTTDSQHRVIVTDTAGHGLHVLAYSAGDSFQIVGGPGRRLHSPSGVAVDADDNIYVSDSERGLVLVYDAAGKFVRTIGSFGEEGLFEHPMGIAIDGKASHLYVVDPPRHTLFILDLQGNVLARIGTSESPGMEFSTRTGSTAPGEFQYPESVLVHNDELIVLDSTRIHILNLQGKFLKEFKITNSADFQKGPFPGIFMDAENHIYVSDPGSGTVREYSHDGQLLGAFGRPGIRMGEFNAPTGMWADSTGRVYIVDARRVQIFQLSSSK
jgi:DNA-binding beta-propeller fold protein YncE